MCLTITWRKCLIFVTILFIFSGIPFVINGITPFLGGHSTYDRVILDENYELVKHCVCSGIGISSVILGGIGLVVAHWRCSKMSYCLGVSLLLFMTILLAYGGIVYYVEGNDEAKQNVDAHILNLFFNDSLENMEIIDEIQETAECCGYEGPSYWGDQVPISCCKKIIKRFGKRRWLEFKLSSSCGQKPEFRWDRGCKEAFFEKLMYIRDMEFNFFFFLELVSLACFSVLCMFLKSTRYYQEFPITATDT